MMNHLKNPPAVAEAEVAALRKTIAEYIAARDEYQAATKPATGFARPPIVSHGDPRLLRYRKARAALDRMVYCGSCGTPVQADPMMGTKCACAQMIPKDREGDLVLSKAGALAILAKTRQFFGGDDDYWDRDDGEPFDKAALDAAIKATTELAAKARAAISPYEGDAYAGSHLLELEEAIKAFDVVR